jgi:hypothetical protein
METCWRLDVVWQVHTKNATNLLRVEIIICASFFQLKKGIIIQYTSQKDSDSQSMFLGKLQVLLAGSWHVLFPMEWSSLALRPMPGKQ